MALVPRSEGRPKFEPGAIVAVEYDGEPGVFHARLILRAATPGALRAVMEMDAIEEAAVFWILTPDGDIYPEELNVPPLLGLCLCDEEGDMKARGAMHPRGRRCRRYYEFGDGSVEELTPLVIGRAMAAAEKEDGPLPRPAPGAPNAARSGQGAAGALGA